MSKKRFTVILSEEQKQHLDYLAWLDEVSPSIVMRDLINEAYKQKEKKEKKIIKKINQK